MSKSTISTYLEGRLWPSDSAGRIIGCKGLARI